MQQPRRIELFGVLRILHGECEITRFRSQKTASLLAFLALHRGRAHPREILVEMLWPDSDPERGRHSLSVALSSLRTLLEPPGIVPDGSVLISDRQTVRLNASSVSTDVSDFDSLLRAAKASRDNATYADEARHIAAAIELYRGDLVSGLYDEWVLTEQQRYDELYFQAAIRLVKLREAEGDLSAALQQALHIRTMCRLREEAHEEVIRLYTVAGQHDDAERLRAELQGIQRRDDGNCIGSAPVSMARGISLALGEPPPVETPCMHGHPSRREIDIDPAGGALPLDSRFYVERPTDARFYAAVDSRDSIVLVKGARQIGKTSLLARGLQRARHAGRCVALTHFQVFNELHLESTGSLLMAIADSMAEQLELPVSVADAWDERRGPNPNFRRFLRRDVLPRLDTPLLWAMDEVDRLFSRPFAGEVFGLFRSWHDERALDPFGPWANLTIAMAYSTEAHLFITDVNQSPFNVGTRLALMDFTTENVEDLNRRYGSPLRSKAEVRRYESIVAGQPYLVCAGLREMAIHGVPLDNLAAKAVEDNWIFGEHLRRIAGLLMRDATLAGTIREILDGSASTGLDNFYRLRAAGILAGDSERDVRFRCPLYAQYLRARLC